MAQTRDQTLSKDDADRLDPKRGVISAAAAGRQIGGAVNAIWTQRSSASADRTPTARSTRDIALLLDGDGDETHALRDICVNLHIQRAARVAGRMQDDAFRTINLTNGQFMLLVSLHRADAPRIGQVAQELALDRTTLTANLKPLERRNLIVISPDETDRRSRRLRLTDQGHELVRKGVKIWLQLQERIEQRVGVDKCVSLRGELTMLAERI